MLWDFQILFMTLFYKSLGGIRAGAVACLVWSEVFRTRHKSDIDGLFLGGWGCLNVWHRGETEHEEPGDTGASSPSLKRV